MTLMSGQVVSLPELYKATNWTCCIPQSFLGDYTSIVKMAGSKQQYYVTADPNCKDPKLIVPAAAYPAQYRAIFACGKCEGAKCPVVDGGVDVALPGDYCTTPDNKPDPKVVCSVAAPICNAGFSGKCEAVPQNSTRAISTGPSLTLQSGLVVDITKLQQQYQGQCCLPRSAIADYTPILRMDNSNGNFFVSNDPTCNTPLDSRSFPAAFDFIHVCDQCPPGGCFNDNSLPPSGPVSQPISGPASQTTVVIINGGCKLLPYGAGTCDPYNYYGGACWGAAPFCSFAGVCAGIPSYGYNWGYDYGYNYGGWRYYRPRWWVPLRPYVRPGWWRPPVYRPGWGYPGGICPPGRPGWRPYDRPDGWTNRVAGGAFVLAGRRPNAPLFREPGLRGVAPRLDTLPKGLPGRAAGPGVILPGRGGQDGNQPGGLPVGSRGGGVGGLGRIGGTNRPADGAAAGGAGLGGPGGLGGLGGRGQPGVGSGGAGAACTPGTAGCAGGSTATDGLGRPGRNRGQAGLGNTPGFAQGGRGGRTPGGGTPGGGAPGGTPGDTPGGIMPGGGGGGGDLGGAAGGAALGGTPVSGIGPVRGRGAGGVDAPITGGGVRPWVLRPSAGAGSAGGGGAGSLGRGPGFNGGGAGVPANRGSGPGAGTGFGGARNVQPWVLQPAAGGGGAGSEGRAPGFNGGGAAVPANRGSAFGGGTGFGGGNGGGLTPAGGNSFTPPSGSSFGNPGISGVNRGFGGYSGVGNRGFGGYTGGGGVNRGFGGYSGGGVNRGFGGYGGGGGNGGAGGAGTPLLWPTSSGAGGNRGFGGGALGGGGQGAGQREGRGRFGGKKKH